MARRWRCLPLVGRSRAGQLGPEGHHPRRWPAPVADARADRGYNQPATDRERRGQLLLGPPGAVRRRPIELQPSDQASDGFEERRTASSLGRRQSGSPTPESPPPSTGGPALRSGLATPSEVPRDGMTFWPRLASRHSALAPSPRSRRAARAARRSATAPGSTCLESNGVHAAAGAPPQRLRRAPVAGATTPGCGPSGSGRPGRRRNTTIHPDERLAVLRRQRGARGDAPGAGAAGDMTRSAATRHSESLSIAEVDPAITRRPASGRTMGAGRTGAGPLGTFPGLELLHQYLTA